MIAVFQDKRPSVDGFVLDASISEEHEIVFAVTGEVLEDGADYTDAIREEPRPLKIVGAITMTPDQFAGQSAFSQTRHIDGWRRMLSIARKRRPFDVVTSLESYQDMVATRIKTTRDAANTHAVIVEIELRSLDLSTVDDAANLADEALDIAASPDELGPGGLTEFDAVVSAGSL